MNKALIFLMATALCAIGTFAEVKLDAPRRVLELPPSPDNPRNSEGDIIALKDGSLLLVYSHYIKGGHGGDHDPAMLASRISSDGGLTWSRESVEVVPPNKNGMNVMSVSLIRLKNGDIALFYLLKNSETDNRPTMRVSKDEGRSWSEARPCIPDEPNSYYVLNNCRVERLSSGRLVLPLCWHNTKDGHIADWAGDLVCYYSDDDGQSWRRGKECFKTFDPQGRRVTTQEPGVIELKDSRVMMYTRTTHGQQWVCYSTDGCDTWSRPVPSNIWGPCAPATIKRLSNGDLFLVWNDHEAFPRENAAALGWPANRRVPLTVAVSKDDGKTWSPRKVLEGNPHGWYCYISVLEHQGNLFLSYCAEKMLCHSRVTIVPVSWLYEPAPEIPPGFVEPDAKPSVFAGKPEGGFTELSTGIGVWKAADGHAALEKFVRGTGVHLLAGENREVVLELPQAADSDRVKLFVERWTSRPPYQLAVEARTRDGEWHPVLAEGPETPVGSLRPMRFKKLDAPVNAYRFRCTSAAGIMICDREPRRIFFNGYFND